jgi:hypothetical protein
MEADREQFSLDQVRLGRLAGADRHVSLAHRQIEILVGDDQRDADIRIERGELVEPRDQPVDAERRRGGDLEVAARPLAAVGELGARRLQLHEHVMRGAEQQVALFGEDQPARVAVEQRHREFLLQRADLPRYCRLRKPELLAGVGKASRLCSRVKDFQLVPIHIR